MRARAWVAGLIVGWFAGCAYAQTEPAATATSQAHVEKIKITIGKDTTFINGPVRADGTIDYAAAYDAKLKEGVTTENNAFVPMVKIFGPGIFSEETRAKVLERLRIAELPADGEYFLGFDDYLKSLGTAAEDYEKFDRQRDEAIKRLWKAEEFPELARWLQRNDKQLNAMVEAAKRDRYYNPAITRDAVSMIGVLFPGLGKYRDVSRALALRISLRVGPGRLGEVWPDALAIHRLARLVSQGGSLIERLVGYSIEQTAVSADSVIIANCQLSSAEAKSCLDDLRKLRPLGSAVRAIDFAERYIALDSVTLLARGNASLLEDIFVDDEVKKEFHLVLDLASAHVLTVDWNSILRRFNRYYDALVAAADRPTYGERSAAFAAISKTWEGLKVKAVTGKDEPNLTERIGAVLVPLFLASLDRANDLYDRALAFDELDEIGFALAAYRADKGRYPETPAALTPDYLKTVPVDRFTDQPLHYRATAEGFVVYSVGDDLVDDGGLEKAAVPGGTRDLVFRVGK